MATPLQMPKIGLTMTEGKVVEWRKQVGDRVEKGEVVFVFETEKTTFDVESPASGFLARVVAEVFDTVQVGEVVGLLADRPGEEVQWPAPAAPAAPRPAEAPPPPAPEGRVVRPSTMRRVIAERMVASQREMAQTFMSASIDATKLLEARDTLAPVVEKAAGVRLTLTDVLVKVAAAAVAAHPAMHSRWTPEGIFYPDAIHMGVATAIDEGLVVPVIRDAGRKALADVATTRARLVERARSGTLTPDELTGGTVTLSSLGMLGVEEFTAIVNPPESAILAVGAILEKPVAIDRQVVVRPVMKVTLTYDHRVIDGATAARFLNRLRELAEAPAAALTPEPPR